MSLMFYSYEALSESFMAATNANVSVEAEEKIGKGHNSPALFYSFQCLTSKCERAIFFSMNFVRVTHIFWEAH